MHAAASCGAGLDQVDQIFPDGSTSSATGALIPDTCLAICVAVFAVFLPWWTRCRHSNLMQVLSTAAQAELEDFATMCGSALPTSTALVVIVLQDESAFDRRSRANLIQALHNMNPASRASTVVDTPFVPHGLGATLTAARAQALGAGVVLALYSQANCYLHLDAADKTSIADFA